MQNKGREKEIKGMQKVLEIFRISQTIDFRYSDWRNDLCICRVFLERVYLMICSRLMTASLLLRRIRCMERMLREL